MPAVDPSRAGRHRQGIIFAALGLGGLAPLMPTLNIESQFGLTLLPVLLFGVSHGGADPLIITSLKRATGRSSIQWLCIYLLLMALVVPFILWQPLLALVSFLLFSIWHFAITDRDFLPPGVPALAGWLSGSLPIVGPMMGHPDQVATLFAWLLLQPANTLLLPVTLLGQIALLVWLAGLAMLTARLDGARRLLALLELGSLAAAMLLLAPLLAFAFYFCGVHSLRHFLLLLDAQGSAKPLNMNTLVWRALPATLIAVALGLLAWWGLGQLQLEAARLADGVRALFWGLAVLTVPHALLVALWSSRHVA